MNLKAKLWIIEVILFIALLVVCSISFIKLNSYLIPFEVQHPFWIVIPLLIAFLVNTVGIIYILFNGEKQ